jgi:hypothetical protein
LHWVFVCKSFKQSVAGTKDRKVNDQKGQKGQKGRRDRKYGRQKERVEGMERIEDKRDGST